MRTVLLISIIWQAIAIGMSFAENISEEKQRTIIYIYRMALASGLFDIEVK